MLTCPNGHPLAVDEIEPVSFSFNSPFGACPVCTGLGARREVDPELIVPDWSLSLARGAIAPWAGWKDGVLPWIERCHAEAEPAAREKYEGFMREVPCPACAGTRLRPEVLAVTVAGRSIAAVAALPVARPPGGCSRWT